MLPFQRYYKKFLKYDIFRIRHWYYYVGFPILGTSLKDPSNPILLSEIVVSILALAFIYSFNDYADGDEKKKFFLIPLLLLIPSLYFVNIIQFFFINTMIILQAIYCSKPFRLKAFPIIGTLCCVFTFPQLFLMGYLFDNNFDWRGIEIFLFLIILVGIAQLFHEVNDIEEDKFENINTTAVALGKTRSEAVCIYLLIIVISFSILLFLQQVLKLLPLLSILFFSCLLIIRIKIVGINFKTWMCLRTTGLFAGIVWYLSLIQ